MPGPLSPSTHVRPFADWLLGRDLPGLEAGRRRAAVDFVSHRVESLPSPIALGVGVIAPCFRALLRIPGGRAVAGFLAAHPVPIAGEYVRLVRSLAYAFVWDEWPDARADGSLAA